MTNNKNLAKDEVESPTVATIQFLDIERIVDNINVNDTDTSDNRKKITMTEFVRKYNEYIRYIKSALFKTNFCKFL